MSDGDGSAAERSQAGATATDGESDTEATGEDAYVVDVKPSARRTNASAGRLVCFEGTRQTFADRATAEDWAADLADADRPVWIRAANPNDRTGADAYLIGRQRTREPGESDHHRYREDVTAGTGPDDDPDGPAGLQRFDG